MTVRVCPQCGQEFVAQNPRKVFCCTNCRVNAHRQKERNSNVTLPSKAHEKAENVADTPTTVTANKLETLLEAVTELLAVQTEILKRLEKRAPTAQSITYERMEVVREDDAPIAVKKSTAPAGKSANNFLAAMNALQGG